MLPASLALGDGGPCSPVYAYDGGPSFERLHEVGLASEFAMLPRFSPDGKYFAYKTLPGGASNKGKISGFVTNIKGSHLHLIRADLPCPDGSGNRCEGEDEDITPDIGGSARYPAGASFPTFSPDGKDLFFTMIVYTPGGDGMVPTQQIFVTSVEPGPDGARTFTRLTNPPPDNPYISHRILFLSGDWSTATWSRFNSHDSDPRHDLFNLEVTICMGTYDRDKKKLSECEPIVEVRPDMIMPILRWFEAKGLSEDGSMLYYSGTPYIITNPEIFVRPTGHGRARQLTRTGPCVWDEQLAFSFGRDGIIVFSSNRDMKGPCMNFFRNMREPSFPFLPPLETYYVPTSGGKITRMTYGFEQGIERSTLAINPADPTDAVLFEVLTGPPKQIRRTRIKFPCE